MADELDEYQRTRVTNEQVLYAFDYAREQGRNIETERSAGANTAWQLKNACDAVLASAAFRTLLVKYLNDRLCRAAERASEGSGAIPDTEAPTKSDRAPALQKDPRRE